MPNNPYFTLADQGIYLGTSSWKYTGWIGSIYDIERYQTLGKFSDSKFQRTCLAEYALHYPTVSIDAAYYQLPDKLPLSAWCGQVPDTFRFALKVTDLFTLKHFPNLPRHGLHAGKPNAHFLDPVAFNDRFLTPLEPFKAKIGLCILEFSRFYSRDFTRGRDFVTQLDAFLSGIDTHQWALAVELRNPTFLAPPYFEVLARHQVAHCYNNWTRMPSVGRQLTLHGSWTTSFSAARFLLTPGTRYQAAVDRFQPYARLQQIDREAREAGRSWIHRARTAAGAPGRPSFLFVNNRLEGHAPATLAAIMADALPSAAG